jgi:curved DNA-binding protein CbpA
MGNAAEDNDGELYTLLGLKRSASDDEIRDAYYRLAKEYHPDRREADANAEETFRAITRAAAILRDPEMRSLYDRSESGGVALGAKLQAARRSSQRRRIALVFLLSLTASTLAATQLWLGLLDRTPERPNLVRNDPGVPGPKVAAASEPPEKASRSDGPRGTPLPSSDRPSLAKGGSATPKPPERFSNNERVSENYAQPPSLQGAAGSAPGPHPAGAGEKVAPLVSGPDGSSHQEQPLAQKTAPLGMQSFQLPPGSSKPPSKVSLLSASKSKSSDCSLSVAARNILLHVSSALRAR